MFLRKEAHEHTRRIKRPFSPTDIQAAALIWWAWLWRSVLLGMGGSIFLSLVLSISGVLNRVSDQTARIVVMALAVIVSVPMGIWAFQMVLEKNFREFKIRLVPNIKSESSQEANSGFPQSSSE